VPPGRMAFDADATVPNDFAPEFEQLKEKLLRMASQAEAAVNRSVKALVRRDDDLALRTRDDDQLIDRLEMEIDEDAIRLLSRRPSAKELRLIITAMKISHNLERVGDEATTISRRCIELSNEPQLRNAAEIPRLASMALQMLKDALDAFVHRDPAKARTVVPADADVDTLYKDMRRGLEACMHERPASISRCLNLIVIGKSLERIADHAGNIAEEVVYMYEGLDIRHHRKSRTPAAAAVEAAN
jgi:phosphate transport system protein